MIKDYFVYMHINKNNKKRYIGITRQDPKVRWANGLGYRTCTYFYNAILKEGWDNFDHVILPEKFTEAEAKAKEVELIQQYRTCVLDKDCWGYNITRGGEGVTYYKTAEEAEKAKKVRQKQYLEEIYADPEKHEKLKEAQRITHAKRKQDPIKHAKDLESTKLANRRRRSDPTIRQQINENARKAYKEKRSSEENIEAIHEYYKNYNKKYLADPDKRQLANERAKAARNKVTQCRKLLIQLYNEMPDKFMQADIQNIFDKKSNSNYKCMTFSVLNEILERVQEAVAI